MHDASHLGIGIAAQRLQERPQGEPARRGGGEHRTAPHVGVRIGDPRPDVGREPHRIPFQQLAERLVRRGAYARIFGRSQGANGVERFVLPPATAAETEEQSDLVLGAFRRRQGRDQIVRRGTLGRHGRHRFQLRAKGSLATLSQGVVPFEVEDRAAQAADEFGKVDGFRVAVANSALPLDHPGEQRLAGCHQLVQARPQLRGRLFAAGDAFPGRSYFSPQAHQLLRVVARLGLEEMSLELGAQRLGVFQSPVQGGDFLTGAGDLVLKQAQTPGFTGLTGRSLGEPSAGLIRFGTRLVERAAQLLESALEQQRPVRAPSGWRASMRSRYAFSQGKRTIRHYSEMREFAKPGGPGSSPPDPLSLRERGD